VESPPGQHLLKLGEEERGEAEEEERREGGSAREGSAQPRDNFSTP
jgi:hypothetical protein